MRRLLKGKNIIRNQILISKLWYTVQIYTFPKYHKGNWEENGQFPVEEEKVQLPRQWAQLSIWKGRLGIFLFETDAQLNYIKTKRGFKVYQISPMLSGKISLYWLKLILNSDQHLALSWQERFTSHKNLQKQNNEDFISQLLYAWLHLTNINIPPPYLYKEFLSNPYL